MCFGGGGGKVTTTSKPSKQTPLEQDVLGGAGAVYQQLLSEMGYELTPQPQRDYAAEIAAAQTAGDDDLVDSLKAEQKAASKGAKGYGATPFTISKRALTPEEQQAKDFETGLTGKYRGMLLGDYSMDPESQKWLDEVFGTEMSEVQRQIDKAATSAAASRGLGLSDTPIGNPYLRTTAEAAQNIFGQKAKASLGMRSEDLARAGGYMTYLDTLKQLKTFQNPMSLAGGISGFGLGLYTPRFSKGTTVQTGGGTSAAGLGGLLQGGGGFLSGIGSLGLGAATGTCWIAAELYGERSDEFYLARYAIFVLWTGPMARLVQRFYLRFGIRIAAFLHRHPVFKQAIRPLFDFAVAKARSFIAKANNLGDVRILYGNV